MNIALALLAGAIVFFAGFCLGFNPPFSIERVRTHNLIETPLMQEYKNFLTYDGSVQN